MGDHFDIETCFTPKETIYSGLNFYSEQRLVEINDNMEQCMHLKTVTEAVSINVINGESAARLKNKQKRIVLKSICVCIIVVK